MRVSEAIERYLLRKRENGLVYNTEESVLSSFRHYVGDLLIANVTPEQVSEFLDARRVSRNRWIEKHRGLRMFFDYWSDRGYISALSMPKPPKRDDSSLRGPFVYSRSEIRRLIQATHGNQSHGLCSVSELTFRTALLMLYGTGAITSEILWLRRDDLNLERGLIAFRGNKIVLDRRVPLGKDLRRILVNYLRSEERKNVSSPNVFVSKYGEPLTADSMAQSFARLRARAGIARLDEGMHHPRMRDIRQTFAVHRIACWIKEGADLNRMLPALSAYMGFSRFCSIQRLLRITPERFKSALDQLSPYKGRKHWRDDPGLMKFLENL